MIMLARDLQQNETDHPGELWANLPPALPVEGGTITARLTDLQGCFNLNNLWRPAPGEQSSTSGESDQDQDKTKARIKKRTRIRIRMNPRMQPMPRRTPPQNPTQPSPKLPNRRRLRTKPGWNRRKSRCCNVCWSNLN